MRTAEEYRALAVWCENVAKGHEVAGRGRAAKEQHQVAAALREAANLCEWMQLIYDFDDGAWAAGRHHNAARKEGITTMRGMAAAALRGESIHGGEPHE